MKKAELRSLFKKKRNEISSELFGKLSEALFKNVLDYFDFEGQYIHLFLPISRLRELNTFQLKEAIESRHKNVHWVISKSNFEDSSMDHFLFEDETVLKENKWGIPEPLEAKPFSIEKIDIIFVPLLVADEAGNRVGYGKGFYDRFLSQTRAKKIGLSLFEPIKKIESNVFDVPLNFVASPQAILDLHNFNL
ncbi:MAG: 5-formyltetrahydrofolate cyclo-ligase [Bacteroidota bacterium]